MLSSKNKISGCLGFAIFSSKKRSNIYTRDIRISSISLHILTTTPLNTSAMAAASILGVITWLEITALMNGWEAEEKCELSFKNVSLPKVAENGFFIHRHEVSSTHINE